jgi:hypothetical protein
MNNRIIPALLCAAAIAFACGPHPQGTAQSVTTAVPRPGKRASSKTAAPVIGSALDARVGDGVTFTLDVTNRSPKLLELTFPSGQTHDFAVVDASGREVWRWSNDRMFTQSLQNRQISASETASYVERMPTEGMHGTYTVVASLESANHPIVERRTFTLP